MSKSMEKFLTWASVSVLMGFLFLCLFVIIIHKQPSEEAAAQIQSYLQREMHITNTSGTKLKVFQCARMDNEELVGWLCAVTLTVNEESTTLIIPFSDDDLNGKHKQQPLQFDHSKDSTI